MRSCVFFILAASPVLADCPMRADLAAGVTLVREEPRFSVTYRQDGARLIEERDVVWQGKAETRRSVYAHPLAVASQESATATVEFAYHADLAPLDRINEAREFAASTTLSVDGVKRADGSYRVFYDGKGEATIGDCTYDVWHLVNEVLLDDMIPMIFWWDYAPALGLIVQTVQVDPEGTPLGSVYYDEIRVEDAR